MIPTAQSQLDSQLPLLKLQLYSWLTTVLWSHKYKQATAYSSLSHLFS